MNMNKKVTVLALLAGLAVAPMTHAADGTINFTGKITDVACTVDTASASQTVALGNVGTAAFGGAAGKTAAGTNFSISLTSCPSLATAATVKFSGPVNADNSSLLALTSGSGVATGVGVGIYEADSSTLIPLSANSVSKKLSATGTNTFQFVAKYVSTAATVGTGTANATSDFTVIYN